MGHITVACGTLFSKRAAYIDTLWRDHIDTALLLTPTARMARTRQEAFVRRYGLPGLWGARAWEIAAFARALLEKNGQPVRMISALERRLLMRQTLETAVKSPEMPPLTITPGLVNHVLRVVNALKQAAIEPGQFRKALEEGRAVPGAFDGLVAAVYDHYQTKLIATGRHDVPGLYWDAEQRCLENAPTIPENATVVLLDGFDDFTPSEQRFLIALSRRVSTMVIGLNYDVDPDRADLFALQQQCLQALGKRASVESVTFNTEKPATYVHYAAHNLFWRNPPPPPDALTANLEIMPCADIQHEIETIGRRIKRLLTIDGAAPHTIAVSLSDIEQCAEVVHEVFEDFGIPHALQTAPSLLATGVGAFTLRLFETLRDWRAQDVTALLTSSLFYATENERELVMTLPVIARHAGVVLGRDTWLPALAVLEKRLDREETIPERDRLPIPRPQAALDLFRRRFQTLTEAAKAFERCNSLRDFASCLDRALSLFHVEEAAAVHGDAARESSAVRAMRSLLEELARADTGGTALESAAFVQFLHDALGETQAPVESAFGAGVVCMGLEGLRHNRYAHVFMGGLNEGLMPRQATINAVYSESDIRRLSALGVHIEGRYEHTFRERLRFHQALCTAEEALVLSWRKLDASGRDAMPSPFMVDVETLFKEHAQITLPEPGPDCFIAGEQEIASRRDLANTLFYRGNTDAVDAFAVSMKPLKRLVAIETQRNDATPFGKYDGIIQAPDLLAWLAHRFGDTAQFSVSRLERYAAFPFNFFVEQVLRLRETRTPEGELDPMVRGIVLHETLQRFHEHYRGERVTEILEADESGARTFMATCVAEVFAQHDWKMTQLPPVVREVEQRRLVYALDRYLSRESARNSEFQPAHFETAFGRIPLEKQDDLSQAAPLVISIEGIPCLFSGKIDRIDLCDNRARIVDYKSSGTPSVKDIVAGLNLQLTVYAWAVERHLLPGTVCAEAFYLPVFKGKPREALLLAKEDKAEARIAAAEQTIAQAVRGIRSGQFPPRPHETLTTSVGHDAARFEPWRIRRKYPDLTLSEEEEGTK